MERFTEILSDTQVLFEVAQGNVILFDTTMDYDGQSLSNSTDILNWLQNKFQ